VARKLGVALISQLSIVQVLTSWVLSAILNRHYLLSLASFSSVHRFQGQSLLERMDLHYLIVAPSSRFRLAKIPFEQSQQLFIWV